MNRRKKVLFYTAASLSFFLSDKLHHHSGDPGHSSKVKSAAGGRECTTAIISGGVTPDGRPLLLKTRDVSNPDQEFVFFDDGEFSYVTVIYAGDTLQAYGGVNSAGFAIENSSALNMPDTIAGPDDDGLIIKAALRTCRTVDDFIAILDSTNEPGRTYPSNYGVIDVEGGAAIFEAGANSYERFDAADSFLVRANYAYTGAQEGRIGEWRHDRAYELILNAVTGDSLTPEYLLRVVCCDLTLEGLNPYPLPFDSVYAAGGVPLGFIRTRTAINRDITKSALVIQGVAQDENPLLSTMYAVPGQPIVSVPIPLWVHSALTPVELDGDPTALLCDLSIGFLSFVYDRLLAGDALNTFQLRDGFGGGLLPVIEPLMDSIFTRTNAVMQEWREELPEPAVMRDFQDAQAEYAVEILSDFHRSTLRRVPDDFENIQDAVKVSARGDTVLIMPGVYIGVTEFLGRNIVLGSLFLTTRDPVFIDSTILDGGQNGRSIVVFRDRETESTVLAGLTLQNAETNFGGGVYCNAASPTLKNLVIKNNHTTNHGAGIYCTRESNPTLQNITFIGNRADGEGGSIHCFNENSIVAITNSIIWDNEPPNLPVWLSVNYCDVQGGFEGVGNIDTDPLFADPDSGCYRLTPQSPCIDVGDPDSYNDPDGSDADIGAFYFHKCDIDIEPEALEFSCLQTGLIDSLAFLINNTGGTPLLVFGQKIIPFDVPFAVGEGGGFSSIEPDSSRAIWVTFTPEEEAEYSAVITVESADPDEESILIHLAGSALRTNDEVDRLPDEFNIISIYPNPFNSITTVVYTLPEPAVIKLNVCDINGREMLEIDSGWKQAGEHQVVLNLNLSSTSLYIIRLKAGNCYLVRKTIYIR